MEISVKFLFEKDRHCEKHLKYETGCNECFQIYADVLALIIRVLNKEEHENKKASMKLRKGDRFVEPKSDSLWIVEQRYKKQRQFLLFCLGGTGRGNRVIVDVESIRVNFKRAKFEDVERIMQHEIERKKIVIPERKIEVVSR